MGGILEKRSPLDWAGFDRLPLSFQGRGPGGEACLAFTTLCLLAFPTYAQTQRLPSPKIPKAASIAAVKPSSLPKRITKSTHFTGSQTTRRTDTHENGEPEGAALVVRGDNITVDFAGRVLEGTSPETMPDKRKGTGLWVSGKNVTIKNARVRGYKIGLLAQNAPGLRITNCDFGNNWKQRLKSTLEREDLSDWMSFHQNEKNEWLRYGAAIYLDNCDGFLVQACRATGGQNGLLVVRSNNGQVVGNNFSFLSGVGLGLYRASNNRVLQNKLDWCVRGYSHGVYNRGQDSAAILVFEQCNKNVFAYNSATHGGDGFFLWAGQTTMDTGQGGCNDNLLYGNDFSHAPTNGIEVTFSRNTIANNLVLECWHGLWGGYSYNTNIVGNLLGFNAQAIAIEHGQHNIIAENVFYRDTAGVRLWQNATQDPNWGYPKHHDTKSHDYQITDNTFNQVRSLQVETGTTEAVTISDALIIETDPKNEKRTMETSGASNLASETDPTEYAARFDTAIKSASRSPLKSDVAFPWNPFARSVGTNKDRVVAPAIVAGAPKAFLKAGALRGRRYILVDEWGPYDFRSPRLWPREPVADQPNTQTFEILGPPGTWKAKTVEGATLSAQSGTVPGFVIVTYNGDAQTARNVRISLEYVGEATTDFRGIVTPKGKPVAFGYSRFVAPIAWTIKWFKWDAKGQGNTPEGWPTVETVQALANNGKAEPIAQTTANMLNLAANGAFFKNLPPDHYATIANGTFRVPSGDYVLETTTDDGCFVWVDDKPVITNAWKYQGPTAYTANLTLAAGGHTIRVCHFQIDGYAALQVKLRPR